MLKEFAADLHVHTVLSPCAAIEMLPDLIVQQALAAGLNIIAITDHNSSSNVQAVQEAAQGTGLVVIPGMELETKEEIHLVCLFEHDEQLRRWQRIVDAHMSGQLNDEHAFGAQLIVDCYGDLLAVEKRMLLGATALSLDEAKTQVEKFGGLCIPAHIDRPANSIITHLGFIPPEIDFAALEISRMAIPEQIYETIFNAKAFPLVKYSDAHCLEDITKPYTKFYIEKPVLSEVMLALKNAGGRSCRLVE